MNIRLIALEITHLSKIPSANIVNRIENLLRTVNMGKLQKKKIKLNTKKIIKFHRHVTCYTPSSSPQWCFESTPSYFIGTKIKIKIRAIQNYHIRKDSMASLLEITNLIVKRYYLDLSRNIHRRKSPSPTSWI